METFTIVFNQIMSLSVFLGIPVSVVLIYCLLIPENSFSKKIRGFVGKHILVIGFLITLAALISSLIYSNVIGYPPCLLCWYTRIVLYPQVILFGIALWKKDFKITDYSIGLTILALIISVTHVISESIGVSVLPCEASGPSCLIKYVHEYGFITIPVMGLVSVVILLLLLLLANKASK